jgi:farnesyl-diphosphate farnesyltransferase
MTNLAPAITLYVSMPDYEQALPELQDESLPQVSEADRERLLGDLLKNVSRSFYLTLNVLPDGLREPIGLGYLLARAADTIADTSIIAPERRLALLLSFRAQVNGPVHMSKIREIENALVAEQKDSHEKILLQSLPPAIAMLKTLHWRDRDEVRRVVETLTRGMEVDLRTFPPETSGRIEALETIDDLDQYIYLVAGCVGEFWTKMTVAHTPALHHWDVEDMSARGIRFGKALQLTNVLRDCAKDLRIGRCYLPLDWLGAHGLSSEALLDPGQSMPARPLLFELLRITLAHYEEALNYLLAIPVGCGRLRLACLWPIAIGLKTIRKLAANKAWLDPEQPSKISRTEVKKIIAFSLLAVGSDTLVELWIRKLIRDVEAEINN